MTQIVCIGLGISKIKMEMLLKWSHNKCSIYEERESSVNNSISNATRGNS